MNTIIGWLEGSLGNPVDCTGNGQYNTQWLVSTIICYLLLVVAFIVGANKKINDKTKKRILHIYSWVMIAFEIFWRVVYLTIKHSAFRDIWPMYPCNLGGIIVPIIALTNNKTMKKMFYLFAFVGANLTFMMPGGIFCRDVFVFPILKSVMQHIGILIIPLYEYAWKRHRPCIQDYGWLFLGLLIHLANCEGIDRLLGLPVTEVDYMFLRSGLPFTIPGIPNYIVTAIFALIVLAILSFVLDISKSKQIFKKDK